MMTRRKFIHGSIALAAAGTSGVLVSKAGACNWEFIQKSGPVKLWTYFLSEEPIAIEGELTADRGRGVFEVRVFDSGKEKSRCVLWLSDIEHVVKTRYRTYCPVRAFLQDGEIKRFTLTAEVRPKLGDDDLVFWLPSTETKATEHPVWIKLSDVFRVL